MASPNSFRTAWLSQARDPQEGRDRHRVQSHLTEAAARDSKTQTATQHGNAVVWLGSCEKHIAIATEEVF